MSKIFIGTQELELGTDLKKISGYDATKIQGLYNNKGTLVWMEDKPQPVDPTDPESWGTGANAGKWTQDFFDDVQTLTDTQLSTLVGKTRKVLINGVEHEVRVIGYNHDDLATGTGKAKLTFQFTKILGDANGYSLATFWKNTNDTSTANYDFINSDIRKALDGQGTGTANWFVKGETTWNSSYAGKSVLDMLPTIVQSNLKEVSKPVATTSSYSVTSYNTKVFIPSHTEMTATSSTYVKVEGATYAYWAIHDSNSSRVIKQIQGSAGALTSYTTVTSGAYTEEKISYAGYNHSTTNGGVVWLRSPSIVNGEYARCIIPDGSLSTRATYTNALGVAPCFCI